MTNQAAKPASPFSSDYVSQLKPDRKVPFKVPTLTQPPDRASIAAPASNEPDYVRRQRISKAKI